MRTKKLFVQETVIQSERLLLRNITTEDLDELLTMYSNDKMFTYRPGMARKNMEAIQKLFDTMQQEYETRERLYLGICFSNNPKKLVGVAEIYDLDSRIEIANIGYSVDENYWGQGVATETVHIMIEYLFDVIEVNRIQAHAMPENVPSNRVLANNGMQKEGLLRQAVFWNGKGIVDVNQYAILKEDWEKRKTEKL